MKSLCGCKPILADKNGCCGCFFRRQTGEPASVGPRVSGGSSAHPAAGHQHVPPPQHGGDAHCCWQTNLSGQRLEQSYMLKCQKGM